MTSNTAAKLFTLKNLYTTSALAVSFVALSSTANADGVVNGTFSSGAGTITQSANQTTITLSTTSSAINFDNFNIGNGQKVLYQHTDDIGHAQNVSRVKNAASIYGNLTTIDVDLTLIALNGIIFGKDAVVNVPNLVVSTGDISDANFNAHNYKFEKSNPNAKIINEGTITVEDGGLAAFVAPTVINKGIIIANKGKVALAAGDEFTLDMYGDKLVSFAVSDEETARLVQQSGKIAADNGVVLLTVQDANKVVSNVVNLDGVVEAKTAVIHGDEIVLGDGARVNTSSAHGGGKVSVTGKKITVAKDAAIAANALESGSGGEVKIFADETLKFDGKIEAKGAGATGKGGFVETSANDIYFGDAFGVNTTDENGGAGEYLIDPQNFVIDNNVDPFNKNFLNNLTLSGLLSATNVTVETNKIGEALDTIAVNADVTKIGGATRSLTLKSNNSVTVSSSANISAAAGKLNVNLLSDNVVLNGKVNTNGGDVKVANKANTGDNTSFSLNSGSVLNAGAGSVTVNSTTANLDSAITAANISGDATNVNIVSNKAKINQGIAIAKNGGTVNVGAGTYDQTVAINKNLTLHGAGAGSTIIAPTTTPTQSFQNFYDSTINDSVILIQSATANINNLTVDGANAPASAAGHRLIGIGYQNAGGTVDFTTVKNTAVGVVAQANGDAVKARSLSVQNSTIQDFKTTGIEADGTQITASLGKNGGNFIKGSSTADFGVRIGRGAAGDVSNTTFLGYTKSGATEIALDGAKDGFEIKNNDLSFGNAGTTGISVRNSNSVQAIDNKVKNHTTGYDVVNSSNIIIGSAETTGNVVGAAITGSANAIINNGNFSNNTYGVYLSGSDNALIQSTKINNNSNDGVQAVNSVNLTLNNDKFLGNNTNGVYLNNVNGAKVIGSEFSNNLSGLYAIGSTGLEFTGANDIHNNTFGIGLTSGSNGAKITGADIHNNTTGVVADTSTDLTITDANIHHNTTGVKIQNGSKDAKIISGLIHDNAIGVSVTDSKNFSITNGNVYYNTGTGVDIKDSANAKISNTKITHNLFGAKIFGSKDAVIENNSTFNNNGEGAILFGSNGAQISGSEFANNTLGGLEVYYSNGVTAKNSKFTGNSTGVYAQYSKDLKLDYDTVSGNTFAGVYLLGSDSATVIDSDVNHNPTGIVVSGSKDVNVISGITHDNTVGISAIDSKNLAITNANVFNNAITGINLDTSNGATIRNTKVYGSNDGVKVTDSNGLLIDGNSQIHDNSNGVLLNNSDNAKIKDSSLYANYSGLNANDSDGLTLNNIQATGNSFGVVLNNMTNTDVKNSNFSSNFIGLQSNGSSGLVADKSTFSQNAQGAQFLFGSNNVIKNSAIESNNLGINAQFTTGLRIENADAKSNATAVNINYGSGNVVTGGTLASNGTGVLITDSNSNTVDGVKIKNSGTGVSVTGGVGNVVNNSEIFNTGTGVIGSNTIGLVIGGDSNIHNSGTGISLLNGATGATIRDSRVHDNGTGISIADSAGVVIDNTKVKGNTDGLLANNATALNITKSLFSDNSQFGAKLTGSANVTVSDSKFKDNQTGLVLLGSNNADISGSEFSGNDLGGAEVYYSSGVTFKKSDFIENGVGLYVQYSDDFKVKNSTIADNDFAGMNLIGSADAKIITAKVYGNGANGISIDNTKNASISAGSEIYENGEDGVHAVDSNKLTITDSNIHNNEDDGVDATRSKNLTVTGSRLSYNADNGVELTKSNSAKFVTDKINHNGNNGAYADRSDELTIDDSNVNYNGYGATGPIDPELPTFPGFLRALVLVGNSGDGIHLVNSNDASVTNTIIAHNADDGIDAISSKRLLVEDSKVRFNADNGISLTDGSNHAKIKTTNIHDNYVGVLVNDSDNVTVRNSHINDNSYGLSANRADNLKLINSTFNSNDHYGAKVRNSANLVVDGSKFNNNRNGLVLVNSDDASITDSKFKNNTKDGIKLTNSNRANVEDSVISGNKTGLESINSNKGKLIGNTFTDNTTGVILGDSSTNWIIRNTQINGGTTGLIVTDNGSSVEFKGGKNQFNGQSDQYISLLNTAMFGQTLRVDDVTFDGFLASTATDDQSFTIEDKITHKMDDNGVGLVLWRDNQVFATKNNLGIQQGINVLANDGIVNIAAGEYFENLTINKGVSLIGRGKGNGEAAGTIINGGESTAVTVSSAGQRVLLQDLQVTTAGADLAILVDGTQFVFANEGDEVPTAVSGKLDFDMSNILITGTQNDAALQFQNATNVGNVNVNDVEFRSTAPTGWKFVNVTGEEPKNEVNAGDMQFGNTIFANTYSLADIQLVNSRMDGFAENVTFEGDGNNPFAREDRVIHVVDDSRLGTIFYTGLAQVLAALDIGNLASDIANRTDLEDVYYNAVSSAGKIYDTPSLTSAKTANYNAALDSKVNINNPGVITLPTQSAAQLAGLAPAAGDALGSNDDNTNSSFANLEPAAGGSTTGGFSGNCSVNFGNDFLSDGLNGISGACQ